MSWITILRQVLKEDSRILKSAYFHCKISSFFESELHQTSPGYSHYLCKELSMHVCVNTSLKWIRDTDLSHLRFVNLYNLPSLRFRYFSSYLFFFIWRPLTLFTFTCPGMQWYHNRVFNQLWLVLWTIADISPMSYPCTAIDYSLYVIFVFGSLNP